MIDLLKWFSASQEGVSEAFLFLDAVCLPVLLPVNWC